MSTQTLSDVVAQSMSDPAFADRFRANPEKMLGDHDLTNEELSALKAGDQQKLDELIQEESGGLVVTLITGVFVPSPDE